MTGINNYDVSGLDDDKFINSIMLHAEEYPDANLNRECVNCANRSYTPQE